MKQIIGLVFCLLWLAVVALSVAVPVAIIWGVYHFVTTYKG